MKQPINGIPNPDIQVKMRISLEKKQRKIARKKFRKFMWKLLTGKWGELLG